MKWGISEQLAFAQLLAEEGVVVMVLDELQDCVVGVKSLNPYLTFLPFTTCAACYLLEHLISALVGPEVGLVKERVGIEDRHQTNTICVPTRMSHSWREKALMISW